MKRSPAIFIDRHLGRIFPQQIGKYFARMLSPNLHLLDPLVVEFFQPDLMILAVPALVHVMAAVQIGVEETGIPVFSQHRPAV